MTDQSYFFYTYGSKMKLHYRCHISDKNKNLKNRLPIPVPGPIIIKSPVGGNRKVPFVTCILTSSPTCKFLIKFEQMPIRGFALNFGSQLHWFIKYITHPFWICILQQHKVFQYNYHYASKLNTVAVWLMEIAQTLHSLGTIWPYLESPSGLRLVIDAVFNQDFRLINILNSKEFE